MYHSTTRASNGEENPSKGRGNTVYTLFMECSHVGKERNGIEEDERSHLYVYLLVLQHLLQLHQTVLEGSQFDCELLCLSFGLSSALQQQALAVHRQLRQIRHLLLNLK